jgi:hypothetical protein
MQRIVTSTKLDERRTRWRIRIESDPCESDMKEPVKQMLLRNFADNPHLLHCGMEPFEQMRMHHNGSMWIVEAEATVENPNAQTTSNATSTQARGSTS